jgi:hypothetical protein
MKQRSSEPGARWRTSSGDLSIDDVLARRTEELNHGDHASVLGAQEQFAGDLIFRTRAD